jgi:hypothetical protein
MYDLATDPLETTNLAYRGYTRTREEQKQFMRLNKKLNDAIAARLQPLPASWRRAAAARRPPEPVAEPDGGVLRVAEVRPLPGRADPGAAGVVDVRAREPAVAADIHHAEALRGLRRLGAPDRGGAERPGQPRSPHGSASARSRA